MDIKTVFMTLVLTSQLDEQSPIEPNSEEAAVALTDIVPCLLEAQY